MLYSLRRGLRNLRTFFWAVWRFETWDYDGLLGLMEAAMLQMRNRHRTQRITADHAKLAKQLTVCTELIKRLRADNYFENAGYNGEAWRSVPQARASRIVAHATYMQKQDVDYFCRMFRNVQCWWD